MFDLFWSLSMFPFVVFAAFVSIFPGLHLGPILTPTCAALKTHPVLKSRENFQKDSSSPMQVAIYNCYTQTLASPQQ